MASVDLLRNGNISVKREMDETNESKAVQYTRWYNEVHGTHLMEKRTVIAESDFHSGAKIRESADNGKTFSDWRDIYSEEFEALDNGDEIEYYDFEPTIYDAASSNFVTLGLMRYFIDGHQAAYAAEYAGNGLKYSDHCYLVYRTSDGIVKKQHIKYEDGADYEDGNPRDVQYFNRNRAYFSRVEFASNGDLLFPIGADLNSCCRILGIDAKDVFPSCPDIMMGVILVRGHWNSETSEYDLTYSKPVVISDVQSSRGVCEPCVAELKSGRIVIVFRGSNARAAYWNTRINPAAPSFKWYLYSDDGGKSFTPAMPWHFDTREVVYSSATISYFFRSSKNGRLYWIGNITDPHINGNSPRYPLQICEVDEDYGFLKKNTLTEIDTRRENESEGVQLSNFSMLENRETKELEIRLTKLGVLGTDTSVAFQATESWTYYISFD